MVEQNFSCLRSFTWQVTPIRLRCGPPLRPLFASPQFWELRADRLYLVRPDGFVAAAGGPAHALIEFASVLDASGADRGRVRGRAAGRRSP